MPNRARMFQEPICPSIYEQHTWGNMMSGLRKAALRSKCCRHHRHRPAPPMRIEVWINGKPHAGYACTHTQHEHPSKTLLYVGTCKITVKAETIITLMLWNKRLHKIILAVSFSWNMIQDTAEELARQAKLWLKTEREGVKHSTKRWWGGERRR